MQLIVKLMKNRGLNQATFRYLKSQISNLKSTAESCSRQLRAWADHLQNSDIKVQRHLNNRERKRYEVKKGAEQLQEELMGVLPVGHPF